MFRYLLVFVVLILISGCTTPSKTPNDRFFVLENPPLIGRAKNGMSIRLGGLSGLWVTQQKPGQIEALAVTDRGPNGENKGLLRPFFLPDYQPRLVKLVLDLKGKTVTVTKEFPLQNGNKKFSGRPFPQQNDGREMEVPVALTGERLPTDPDGLDPESLCMAKDGTLWMGEEYGPDLLHFSMEGRLLHRFRPGEGLPGWLRKRKVNGGFEGVACIGGNVFAILQSPLDSGNPIVPVLQFDPQQGRVVAEFSYPLGSKDHKIGDMYATDGNHFYVIEQNGKSGREAFQKIFEFSPGEAKSKREVLDLVRAGYQAEKAEGLVHLGHHLLVISDNDFNLSTNPQKTQLGYFEINSASF